MKNWQIALISISVLSIAAVVAISINSSRTYASAIDGISESQEEAGVVNRITRKYRYVLKRDRDRTFGEDVFKGWSFEWCKRDRPIREFGGCTRTDVDVRTFYVEKGEGWPDRLRHETLHVLLFETNDDAGNHHNFMGKHGWCFGSKNNCVDRK